MKRPSRQENTDKTRELEKIASEVEIAARGWKRLSSVLKQENERLVEEKKYLLADIARLEALVERLTDRVLDEAHRDPILLTPPEVDTAGLITKIGDSFARILAPNISAATIFPQTESGQSTSEPQQPRQWAPDVEFDEYMDDPTNWPTRGGWVNNGTQNGQSLSPSAVSDVLHGPPRPDGQPLFRAGEGAAPPEGGIE